MIKNKNHGITGSKRKGHKTNSDPNPGKQIENKSAPDKISQKNATKENVDPKDSKACSRTTKSILTSLV